MNKMWLRIWSQNCVQTFIFAVFISLALVADCRKKSTSDDKTALMVKLSSQNGIASIDNSNFKSLVKTTKRPYSVLLMFTVSHPRRKCLHCKEAFDEFEIAAASWRFSNNFEPTMFFAKVDYDLDGTNVFHALQINTAPVVLFFEAGSNKHQLMFFEKFGYSAEGYAKFLLKTANARVTIARPLNYTVIFVLTVVAFFFVMLIYTKRLTWSTVQSIPWAFIVLFFVLLMTSGHMWNHIRGAQFMHYKDKEMVFIETWGDGQLVVESYIIFALNLAIGVGIILMCEISGKSFPVTKKKVAAIAGILLTTFFFYLLLNVFRKKYEGYPYSFFFL